MRVRHPHSYKGFLPKNTHRKKRGLEMGGNDRMGGTAPTHLVSELQCEFAEFDEKIDEDCQYYQFHNNLLFSIPLMGIRIGMGLIPPNILYVMGT